MLSEWNWQIPTKRRPASLTAAANKPSPITFEKMTEKRPELHIGYAWRAKCLSQLDPDSKEGKAKPYYEKVLEIIGDDEEKIAKYQRDFITAHKYLGAYYTLVSEEFDKGIPHWEKILELKPEDEGSKNGLDYCKQKVGG